MSNARKLAANLPTDGQLGNRNLIINGAMNVAQRGASSTGVGGSDGYFTCDRWHFAQATNAGRLTMTQDSSAPAGFANSLKLACTTADTSIGSDEAALIQHRIEGQDVQRFAKGTSGAKEFTVSFYVKGNASATYTAELFDNNNTRCNGKTFSVTTDWTRVELTFPADTTGAFTDNTSAGLFLNIWIHAGTTYTGGTFTNGTWTSASSANVRVGSGTSFFDSTARTFFITGVQLEVGPQSTPFEHEPYSVTLAKCQRYYYRMDGNKTTWMYPIRTNNSSGYRRGSIHFPVTMRAAPTATVGIVHNGGTSGVDGGVWIGPDCVGVYVNDINSETEYAYVNALDADAEL